MTKVRSTSRVPQAASAPLPAPDERTRPFWAGLERGELVLQACGVCEAYLHPAAVRCRTCESTQLHWTGVEPRGRLYSWAVERREIIAGVEPPYVFAQVTPSVCADGDVRLMCTLLVDDPATLVLGAPVRLVPSKSPGTTTALAYFTVS